MKNIINKVGVIGLIIAMLVPFVEVPVVNALEDGCTRHLQSYYFLDFFSTAQNYDNDREVYDSTTGKKYYTDGYTTYTNFPFVFDTATEGEKVTVESIDFYNLSDKTDSKYDDDNYPDDLLNYWDRYNKLVVSQNESSGSIKRSAKYCNTKTGRGCTDYNLKGGALVSTPAKREEDYYDTITDLIHGVWARQSATGTMEIMDWEETDPEDGALYSYQYAFNEDALDEMKASIGTAKFEGGNEKDGYKFIDGNEDLSADYLNDILSDVEGALGDNRLWEDEGEYFLPLSITRNIDKESVFDQAYYYIVLNQSEYYFSTSSDKLENSFEAYSNAVNYGLPTVELKDLEKVANGTDGGNTSAKDKVTRKSDDQNILEIKYKEKDQGDTDKTVYLISVQEEKVDVNDKVRGESQLEVRPFTGDDNKTYYAFQYYWPFVFNVEYTVCPTNVSSDDPTTEVWTLKYDGNVDDNSVSGLPSSQTEPVGTKITVSKTKPKRSGYTFKGWCEDPKGKKCYEAGDKISDDGPGVKYLYANWGEEGTKDNPPTGVISYVIGFAGIGLIAGGIYIITKKKNFFKQI